MEAKPFLVVGENAFTILGLIRKAATYKGLEFKEGDSTPCSRVIKEYALDHTLLALLAEQNINRQTPSAERKDIFTLVDKNPQIPTEGFVPSNYWNFKRRTDGPEFDLRISLSVVFSLDMERRGIVFWPHTHGTILSPASHLPNFRMFKALTENDKEAALVAKEIAASEEKIVVTWSELGLGGIRSLSALFAEFAGRNETVQQLKSRGDIFSPIPHLSNQRMYDELWITEPIQPKVFEAWRGQLERYRNKLIL